MLNEDWREVASRVQAASPMFGPVSLKTQPSMQALALVVRPVRALIHIGDNFPALLPHAPNALARGPRSARCCIPRAPCSPRSRADLYELERVHVALSLWSPNKGSRGAADRVQRSIEHLFESVLLKTQLLIEDLVLVAHGCMHKS